MADNNDLRSCEVITRLIEIITNISEPNRRQLLKVLEKNIQSKFSLRREHPREPYKINIDFTIDEFPFRFFTHNVSKSGAFIETDLPFLKNKALSMTFELPSYEAPIRTTGKIVRTDSAGIGVKFDEPLSDL
ncbi:MAG: PilZ domain-containing protein [Desulfobacterales bacterium]|nr:MAG: PilZ domain-containing protein [Desulfobacterales bacterium]